MSEDSIKLRIMGTFCAITVHPGVARAGGVPPDQAEVTFTRARVLLEAQWLKTHRTAQGEAWEGKRASEPHAATASFDKPA